MAQRKNRFKHFSASCHLLSDQPKACMLEAVLRSLTVPQQLTFHNVWSTCTFQTPQASFLSTFLSNYGHASRRRRLLLLQCSRKALAPCPGKQRGRERQLIPVPQRGSLPKACVSVAFLGYSFGRGYCYHLSSLFWT